MELDTKGEPQGLRTQSAREIHFVPPSGRVFKGKPFHRTNIKLSSPLIPWVRAGAGIIKSPRPGHHLGRNAPRQLSKIQGLLMEHTTNLGAQKDRKGGRVRPLGRRPRRRK